MKFPLLQILIILCVLCFKTATAQEVLFAQEARIVPVDQWQIGVSIGYGKLQSPLGATGDLPLYVIPDIRYYSERFSLENTIIGYSLYQRKKLVIELIGRQNLDGLFFPGHFRKLIAATSFNIISPFDPDAAMLIKPKHKSLSYMAGFDIRYYGSVDLLAALTHDVSNVHHGFEIEAIGRKLFEFDNFIIEAELGVTYKDSDLVGYYYSVDDLPDPVVLGAKVDYQAKASVNYHVTVQLAMPLKEQWYVTASIKNLWQGAEITNSPVVVRDQVSSFFIGLKRMF